MHKSSSKTSSWGPAEPRERTVRGPQLPKWARRVVVPLALYGWTLGPHAPVSVLTITAGVCQLIVLGVCAARGWGWAAHAWHTLAARVGGRADRELLSTPDPVGVLRHRAARAGGGVHLGHDTRGRVRFSRAQRAVLILGPPRSGKTSGVIIPTLISHQGPVVAASTKPDVLDATRPVRGTDGRVWVFDPTGTVPLPTGVRELAWSPVTSSGSWDGALIIARAMTATVGTGVLDRSHWANRSQALLAAMLHAAATHDLPMGTVVDWVLAHDLDEAGALLEDERCSRLAFQNLLGLFHTEDRERSSIFSAAADALQAYTHEHALATTRDPNFDPDQFVRSRDTIYITAPAEAQAATAPLVCGLLTEIRRATYAAHASGRLPGRVLFALDEAANIAPLAELPQIASEGGGQGLLLLAALQDLSQARERWGHAADGFLTLFGTKLLLPGIADTRTLEAVSTMLGEYDREVISHTRARTHPLDWFLAGNHRPAGPTQTTSTQRTRVLSPGEIAQIPAGHGLHLDAAQWELLTLTPAHTTDPYRTLIEAAGRTAA